MKDSGIDLEKLGKFIKDVGFPVIAFLLMFYMCMNTMNDNTLAIQDLTRAIELMGR